MTASPTDGSVATLRLAPTRPVTDERRVYGVPRSLVLVWAALFLNVLTFLGPTVLPIARPVGQMITQGVLGLALLLALALNPRGVMRPTLFLVLLTVLAVVAVMVSIHSVFTFSSTYRACRFTAFILVLWLTTAWWGRSDMLLLRCHRRCLWFILGSVVAGVLVAPGSAFAFDGRLSGVIWPIQPTQVAHYAAVLFGTTVVLWLCRVISGRHTVLTLAVSGAVLVATHTRTALLACVVGLVIAAASLFLGHVRVRRTSVLGMLAILALGTLFASQLTSWALRGQSTEEVGQLTGRTEVWTVVFNTPRSQMEEMFGSGLSNQSFQGLPIDSNWVATYLDQGWFGIIGQVLVVVVLLLMAASRARGPRRAVALFLVVYCVVASFTETGLGIGSPYLLDLTVAASLLTRSASEGGG